MEKLKVGVIGTGGMGVTHAGAYMLDDRVTVSAACSTNKEQLDRFINQDWPEVDYYKGDFTPVYKIEQSYTNYEDMLRNDEIDIVSICTPNSLHYPIAKLALEMNKHVLVEKPIATSYKQAKELVELSNEVNKQLAVGHMWRFHPHVEYAKRVIKTGMLGEILKLKGYGIHEDWTPTEGWFTKKQLAGGGALIDMGIHPIDTMRYLLGENEVTEAYANMSTEFGDYNVEDIGVVFLTFEENITAIVEFGWGNPHKDGVESSIQIFGSQGYMRIFPTHMKLSIADSKGKFVPNLPEVYLTKELYSTEISHVIDGIEGEKEIIISGEEGMKTLNVVDKAYEANEKNKIQLT